MAREITGIHLVFFCQGLYFSFFPPISHLKSNLVPWMMSLDALFKVFFFFISSFFTRQKGRGAANSGPNWEESGRDSVASDCRDSLVSDWRSASDCVIPEAPMSTVGRRRKKNDIKTRIFLCVCVCVCVWAAPCHVRDVVTLRFPWFRAPSIALPGFLPGFDSIELDLTRFSWIFLGFTGFYWVLLGFTGFYRVFLGSTGFL